jgi:hypothetical protein
VPVEARSVARRSRAPDGTEFRPSMLVTLRLLPCRDPELEAYVDSGTGVVLTSWEQALDQLDEDADEKSGAAIASSLSLAMDLTTIWVCPPKYTPVQTSYFKENWTFGHVVGHAADVWGQRYKIVAWGDAGDTEAEAVRNLALAVEQNYGKNAPLVADMFRIQIAAAMCSGLAVIMLAIRVIGD